MQCSFASHCKHNIIMYMYAVDTYYEANDNSSDEEAELADDATLPDSSRCKLNEKLIFLFNYYYNYT